MKDNFVYITHILDSISKIRFYIQGYDFQKFFNDDKTVDAVVRQIEIIGEASNKCAKSFKNKYPEIPWREMISMRNKMIHDYFGVIKQFVWDTSTIDLPELQNKLIKILEKR